MTSHVLGVNNPLVGMFAWSPSGKRAQVFFILSLEFFTVDTKESSNDMAICNPLID